MIRTATATQRARATRIGCDVAELEAHEAACEAWCHGCRLWLAEVAFASNMSRPSGRAAYCQRCNSAQRRERKRRCAA